MKNNILKLTILLGVLFMAGCASTPSINRDKIVVKENKIYYNDKLYAELRFYAADLVNQYPDSYRGISIYYYDTAKEEWIYRNNGLDINTKEYNPANARGDTERYVGNVFNISISDDARYVSYKKPTGFYISNKKYKIKW
jgi:hypothetical protein